MLLTYISKIFKHVCKWKYVRTQVHIMIYSNRYFFIFRYITFLPVLGLFMIRNTKIMHI